MLVHKDTRFDLYVGDERVKQAITKGELYRWLRRNRHNLSKLKIAYARTVNPNQLRSITFVPVKERRTWRNSLRVLRWDWVVGDLPQAARAACKTR